VAALPPLHREVTVALDPQQAFELFTKRIGDWWPMAMLSVFGQGSSVAFTDDGRLLERHGEQATSWGEVTEWEPGERLAITWHPGHGEDEASHLTVTFSAYGEQTLVTLVHTGWEAYDDAITVRDEYAGGWPKVLAQFIAAAGGDPEQEQEPESATWAALLFTPAEGQGAAVFEDERFAGHIGFLNLMEDSGYLVAAGPLLDDDGSGMTILRLPGDGRLDEIERLAEVDTSVSSGLFTVRVRPWRVFFAPGVR
jgi:uncharacterized protein YciI/uncharacterized protein YndB with AHSA1/START domain